MAIKLHQGPVFIEGMVNWIVVLVHFKINFVNIVQTQLFFPIFDQIPSSKYCKKKYSIQSSIHTEFSSTISPYSYNLSELYVWNHFSILCQEFRIPVEQFCLRIVSILSENNIKDDCDQGRWHGLPWWIFNEVTPHL